MAKARPTGNKLFEETLTTLRVENKKLHSKNIALLTELKHHENNRLKWESRYTVAEDRQEALYDAIRVLAEQVSNRSANGRKAREAARKILEAKKISPPVTLGSSRQRKVKRRRRKKTLTRSRKTS
jgi:hypothetical protein